MPETKSQRLTRRMKKDAERQQRRREKMADGGKPETHAVDRAISEAVAYVAMQSQEAGAARRDVQLGLRDVLLVAAQILAHRGRFDAREATKAVVARTSDRKAHLWSLPEPRRPDA